MPDVVPFSSSPGSPSARSAEPADPFLRAVRCPSGRVSLVDACLALVLDARPDADVDGVRDALDTWGARLSRRLRHAGVSDEPFTGALMLSRMLFEEEGFHGDADTPLDPGNGELDRVVERRRGLPITLAIVHSEVGRRAGLPVHVASYPTRLLVAVAVAPRPILFDPFREGRLVLPEECQGLVEHSHDVVRLKPELTAPCPPRRLLERLLTSLKHAYLRQADIESAIRVQSRAVDLRPEAATPLTELARLEVQAGRLEDALRDLERAADLVQDQHAVAAVRRQLEQVRRWSCSTTPS
jgi:regulator of sirC expression with transglutaminase-like and TPR domain